MRCFCGGDSFELAFKGAIREGARGTREATVHECLFCGVQRLGELRDQEYYESGQFRSTYDEPVWDHEFHDSVSLQFFSEISINFRDKTVVDVGAGGGSFLDLISGLARPIAVEPDSTNASLLRGKGYDVYAYAKDVPCGVNADYVVSFDVIEHVVDPCEFLRDLAVLGSRIVLTTPNRNDVLMQLVPEFRGFWYRAAHNWYFDHASLCKCAEAAGVQNYEVRFLHRFGLSNVLGWLKERKPVGQTRLPGINAHADALWKAYLEREGLSDYLVLFCTL